MKESLEFNTLKSKVENLQAQHETLNVQNEQVENIEAQAEGLKQEIVQVMGEVKKYEESLGLSPDDPHVQEIEDELRINLKNIEDQIQGAGLENQESVSEVTPEQKEVIRNILKAEDRLRVFIQKRDDLEKRYIEMNHEDHALLMKSIEAEILQTRGKICKSEDELKMGRNDVVVTAIKQKIRNESRVKGVIPAYSESEKEYNYTLDKGVKTLNTISAYLKERGTSLDSVDDYNNSGDPAKQEVYNDFTIQAENLELEQDVGFLISSERTRQEMNSFLQTLQQLDDIGLRTLILSELVSKENCSPEKLTEALIKNIDRGINKNEFSVVQEGIETRLQKDTREAILDFPPEDFLDFLEDDPKMYEDSPSPLRLELKIGELVQDKISSGDVEEVKDLFNRLVVLQNSISRFPSVERFFPESLRSVSHEDMLDIVAGKISDEDFDKQLSGAYVPLSLVPDNLLSKYVNNIFESRTLDSKELNQYFEITGKTFGELSVLRKAKVLKDLGLNSKNVSFTNDDYRNMFTGNYIDVTCIPMELRSTIKEEITLEQKCQMLKNNKNKTEGIEFTLQDYKEVLEFEYMDTYNIPKEYLDDLRESIGKGIKMYLLKNGCLPSGVQYDKKLRDHLFEVPQAEGDDFYLEKIAKNKNIQDSYLISESPEELPEQIKNVLEEFQIKYGYKGKTLVSLAVVAYGIESPENFLKKMQKIETILDKYDPASIPDGGHVSMGIEYEVTDSVGEEYKEKSSLGYKGDITLITQSSNLGVGGGGANCIHEIYTKPTYNPYVLLAETQLLQEAGLFDLNFNKYPLASRGYHLSLVGDSGLKVDQNMYFLNNMMTAAQLTGITAGKDVHSTKDVHVKSFEHFNDKEQGGSRCELKGMSTDSVEQFERSIITSHHAGIAIQLSNKYLGEGLHVFEDLPVTAQEFEGKITTEGLLTTSFKTDKERDMVYEWIKLQHDMVRATERQNKHFLDTEFQGGTVYENGEYVETSEHILAKENRNRLITEKMSQEELHESVKIDSEDLFGRQTSQFVNALTHLNNFFLLKAVTPSDSQYITIMEPDGTEKKILNLSNISSVFLMKNEGYKTRDGDGFKQQTGSIFEKSILDYNGELRDGYYNTAGTSEEMMINKSQILLARFNNKMGELLKQEEVQRDSLQDNNATASVQ